MKKSLTVALLAVVVMTLPGCERVREIFHKEDPPLPGRRQSVLPENTRLRADQTISDIKITLPRPSTNRNWPQASGFPSHAMQHLTLGKDPRRKWRVSVGRGSTDDRTMLATIGLSFQRSRRLLAQPVVGDGRVFAMDATGEVSAYDLTTGRRIWRKSALPKREKEGDLGGGIGYAKGRLYVSTGAAEVVAFDAATGKEIWRAELKAPARSAPAIANGRLFVVTVENEVVALSTEKGERLWNYSGVASTTGILGGGTPAVAGGFVIAPQSSGELVALRAENGHVVWSESIAATRRRNPITNLTTITANPIVDRGMVFAVSNAGRLVAIDLQSGRRAWDLDIGGLETPWVAGNYIYVITNRGELAAVTRDQGKVRWVIRLEKFVDDKDLVDGRPNWAGPVLASDRLVVAGSHGEALSVSPYTGEVVGWVPLDKGVMIQPVVANNTILFLDITGRLSAYR
jgi:outer membrane protein assembly factor BamB